MFRTWKDRFYIQHVIEFCFVKWVESYDEMHQLYLAVKITGPQNKGAPLRIITVKMVKSSDSP